MFHVLEHLKNPVQVLKKLIDRLRPGGILYIEVPHVNDALLSVYDVNAYRKFSFFSDHLHYFSRESMCKMLTRAGAVNPLIIGHNRFNLSNHLFWLRYGKPGGHKFWTFLNTPELQQAYARALAAANVSDTILVQYRKPET